MTELNFSTVQRLQFKNRCPNYYRTEWWTKAKFAKQTERLKSIRFASPFVIFQLLWSIYTQKDKNFKDPLLTHVFLCSYHSVPKKLGIFISF